MKKKIETIKTIRHVADADCPKCGFIEIIRTRNAQTMQVLREQCSNKMLNVSERTVFRYIKAKKLKAFKMGSWRITNEDYSKFILSCSNIKKL